MVSTSLAIARSWQVRRLASNKKARLARSIGKGEEERIYAVTAGHVLPSNRIGEAVYSSPPWLLMDALKTIRKEVRPEEASVDVDETAALNVTVEVLEMALAEDGKELCIGKLLYSSCGDNEEGAFDKGVAAQAVDFALVMLNERYRSMAKNMICPYTYPNRRRAN